LRTGSQLSSAGDRIMVNAAKRESAEQAPLANAQIADRLEEVGRLLEERGANPFRVRAYRTAAQTLRAAPDPAHEVLKAEGLDGLTRWPGIGESLARAIERMIRTGRLEMLERLQDEHTPERLLASVSGIGRITARRIHEQLGIEDLADLEAAAYDGRLERVPRFGTKRIRAVRESLAGRFRRRPPVAKPRRVPAPQGQTPVAEILDVDAEYRLKASRGLLPKIAPRRFNPTAEAWLPVLRTRRGPRRYTALFSNTARAHELGTTHDWVVVRRDDKPDGGRWTVITARFPKLKGRRIVRGREKECVEHYDTLVLVAGP
jgi:DNA polymerase (family 10)